MSTSILVSAPVSTSIAEKSYEAETSMACNGICAQRTGGGIHCLVGQDKRRSNGCTAKRPRILGYLVLALGGGGYVFD